jgi:DNA-binding MarR family transcriptional regulator
MVLRETDPASRRRIRLTLSQAGLAVLETAELRTTEWLERVLGSLDEARLAALADGLRALRDVVAGDGRAAGGDA